jgi:hypothetical protein
MSESERTEGQLRELFEGSGVRINGFKWASNQKEATLNGQHSNSIAKKSGFNAASAINKVPQTFLSLDRPSPRGP